MTPGESAPPAGDAAKEPAKPAAAADPGKETAPAPEKQPEPPKQPEAPKSAAPPAPKAAPAPKPVDPKQRILNAAVACADKLRHDHMSKRKPLSELIAAVDDWEKAEAAKKAKK